MARRFAVWVLLLSTNLCMSISCWAASSLGLSTGVTPVAVTSEYLCDTAANVFGIASSAIPGIERGIGSSLTGSIGGRFQLIGRLERMEAQVVWTRQSTKVQTEVLYRGAELGWGYRLFTKESLDVNVGAGLYYASVCGWMTAGWETPLFNVKCPGAYIDASGRWSTGDFSITPSLGFRRQVVKISAVNTSGLYGRLAFTLDF